MVRADVTHATHRDERDLALDRTPGTATSLTCVDEDSVCCAVCGAPAREYDEHPVRPGSDTRVTRVLCSSLICPTNLQEQPEVRTLS
jgi:hypothetical protein